MKRRDSIRLLAMVAITCCYWKTEKAKATSWSYQGETGTDFWGELDPEFMTCSVGNAQSPVNIEGSGFSLDVGSIDFNYQDTPLAIVNNNRTIRVDYQPGSSLSLDGKEYELLQFHFHQPSEHLISGKAADMEAHFVHQNKMTGDLVVLALFMSEGKTNQALESIWQEIPTADSQVSQVADLTINALQLLPEDSKRFYRYQGSLTTPPCSEIVTWLVLKQPVEISRSQIASFLDIIGVNARPVQALNQRTLSESP
ncbi:MAG: carbonic anhydrase family protein [Cyanobacteria bacterium J06600_6]